MPEEFSRPDLGAPGGEVGREIEGTSTGRTWWGKSVTYVVERRYLNRYRRERGSEPERRTERTGRVREATDGTLCWEESEEIENIYYHDFDLVEVAWEQWLVNQTLQSYYDHVNSWGLGTAGGVVTVTGAAGAAASSGENPVKIARWLLGDGFAGEGFAPVGGGAEGLMGSLFSSEALGGSIAAGAGLVADASTVAGVGIAAFYITTNIMDSEKPAGTKESEGWKIIAKKPLGVRLRHRGTPRWVQTGEKHPCHRPVTGSEPPPAERIPGGGTETDPPPRSATDAPPATRSTTGPSRLRWTFPINPLMPFLVLIIALVLLGTLFFSLFGHDNRRQAASSGEAPRAPAAAPSPSAGNAPAPTVSALRASLSVPVTTYSVDAKDPAGGSLSYVWRMSGEMCGTPRTPWTQTGPTAHWSHSDSAPDSCQHHGTDHDVTVSVTISSSEGASVVCVMTGTETIEIKSPPCH